MPKTKMGENIEFPEIVAEIDCMAQADKQMRERNVAEPNYWDDSVDKRNIARMKEIVAQIGWPTIPKVGVVASTDAWLLVQHADNDIEFQKHCLGLMKLDVEFGVRAHDIAYLEDRVRVNVGQMQIYGTQFNFVRGQFIPKEIEDPDSLDNRRREMGLLSMKKSIEEMYKKYKIKRKKKTQVTPQ